MTKTIPCNKCRGRGYFTYEQRCTAFCGVAVSRCEVCQGKGMIEVPVTNADHIRSMADEELAKCLAVFVQEREDDATYMQTWLDWLKQPYKEGT